jgi:hypothetical protein
MNPIILLFLNSFLASKDEIDIKLILMILNVLSQQQGHANIANFRRMASNTSPDALAVSPLAALKEDSTGLGVNDPHNIDMIRRIMKDTKMQF